MTEISLRSDLDRRGMTGSDIRAMLRSGDLQRIRRGAYADPDARDGDPDARETEGDTRLLRRHRSLLAAAARQLSGDAVISHQSAAVLLGLPVWPDQLDLVHLTRGRPGGGRLRAGIRIHGLPLDGRDVVTVGGVDVTGPARTFLDLGCSQSLERSVAVGDAVLRAGAEAAELVDLVGGGARRTGIGRARRAVQLLDDRSESAGESASRVAFHLQGLPPPDLQFEVFAPDGHLVGRTDTAWPEFRTLGEFDGKVKYGRLLKPGQRAEDVVWSEKLREDALRELGWEVVRWTWRDLGDPTGLSARVRRAFVRGRQRWT